MMKTLIRGFITILKGDLLVWAILLGFSAFIYVLQQIF
jgi:hypothetical protein